MKTKQARSNFGPRGWLLVILCLFGSFMSTALAGSLNVSSAYFNAMYGWSQTSLMFGVTIGTIIGVLIAMFGGKLILKKSPRRMIFVFALIFAVCFILNGRSTSLPWFYITYILGTVCAFFWSTVLNPILIANWFPRKTGLVMGWVTMGMPLGAGFSAFILRAVYVNVGFHQAYYPYAVLAVVLGILYMAGLKDFPTECGCYPDNDKNFDPEQLRKEEEAIMVMRQKSPWTPKRVLTTKEFWFVWVGLGCLGFCGGLPAQIVPVFVSFGVDTSVATYCMLLVCVIACVGSFLLGKIDAWYGPKRAIYIACILLYIMVVIEQANSFPCKIIAFVLVGVIMGGASNFMLSLCMRTWEKESCMSVFRFAQPLQALVTGFASTIFSAVATGFGSYNMAFILMGILGVISLILIINVKKENIEKKEKRFLEQSEG